MAAATAKPPRVEWRGHGLRITHARSTFPNTALHRGSSDDEMVRLHFGLRGDYTVRYPHLDRSFELAGGHHNIFYSKPFELEFVNKTPVIETFGVQFPVEQFVSYVDGASELLSRFCDQIVNAGRGILFEPWAPVTPVLEQTISQMIDCRYVGPTKDLFLLSKSIELLVLSIEGAPVGNASAGHLRSSGERDKIVAARDCVNDRLGNPPTLTEVARAVGLNEYKLKRGFKEMFGTTVFAYLSAQRLELAKRTLLDTDKQAAEVAFELGYATPQHFSHAFKRRFGVAPKSVRKNPG